MDDCPAADSVNVWGKTKTKSSLACFDVGHVEAEVNLLSRLCWYGAQFLRSLRTVLFLRREQSTKSNYRFLI